VALDQGEQTHGEKNGGSSNPFHLNEPMVLPTREGKRLAR
jgi:hypothetical protein